MPQRRWIEISPGRPGGSHRGARPTDIGVARRLAHSHLDQRAKGNPFGIETDDKPSLPNRNPSQDAVKEKIAPWQVRRHSFGDRSATAGLADWR